MFSAAPTRLIAILLTVLTGASGLVYEVSWQKYLATLLGSHSEATAAVLAIFLGGLSAGYALFGVVTRRLVTRARRASGPPRLLLVYGLVEIGIGLYALLFPSLFGVAEHVSLLVPGSHPVLGFAFDLGLSTLLIGPPTILMGGTIPILTLALAGDLEHATRIHAWVYGFNTIGAFVGALVAAFFLIPALGLDSTLYSMACVNLIAGGTFALLDRGAMGVAPDFSEVASPGAAPKFTEFALVALLAGFAMMTLQTTLNRVGALALGSSPFTFAMIVAAFVLCIALGSLVVSVVPRIPKGLLDGSQWALVALLVVLYLHMDDAPYWAHTLRSVFQHHDGAFYPFQIGLFASLLALLLLPIGLSGALLPLIFDRLRREVADLGSVAGRLYAWNTVGSLLGAVLGGYLLFFWLDLHQVFRVALGALVLGAAILSASVWQRSTRHMVGWVVLPVWVALFALPPWSPEQLTAGLFRKRDPVASSALGPDEVYARFTLPNVVFYDDDPTSTVSVTQSGEGETRNHSIVVNGKSDGSLIGDYVTMSLTGLLPALMAESHERCFVIGLGTGVTAGELATLEGTREVNVAEISHAVIEAAPFFDYGNLGASQNPKLKVKRGDAYRTLQKTEGLYDIIVSEPSNPWVTGVEMLFSREFLEAARSRLAPGGVYAQWFHLYEVDDESVQTVLRTYASVFPHVSVWFAQGMDLLLLGVNDTSRALDVAALETRFASPEFTAGFARARINTFPELLAHELLPLGTLHAALSPGEVHTLRHPILSDMAARAFFRGGTARVPPLADSASASVGAENSLLRRYAGVGDREPLPEALLQAAFFETCGHRRWLECTTLLARWRQAYPESEAWPEAAARIRGEAGPAQLPREVVAQIAPFFNAARPMPAKVPAQMVLKSSNYYVKYFHHAVPFDARVIEQRWERCVGKACEMLSAGVEARLGLDLAQPRGGAMAPEGVPVSPPNTTTAP